MSNAAATRNVHVPMQKGFLSRQSKERGYTISVCRCEKIYKRHSNSIDTVKKVCGRCQSKLQFLGRFNHDGTLAVKRGPSQFSLFVKQHFSAVKQTFPAGSQPSPPSSK